MVTGLTICYYYATQDLPPISDRNWVAPNFNTMPLFFGTTLFAFEGIALVLPLQNSMKKPKDFSKPFGVLNVGMIISTAIYSSFGFLGYWKYGESTEGSITLNLPTNEM
jgi:solute carrier family 36 (proton-coupled amino acid transporter)